MIREWLFNLIYKNLILKIGRPIYKSLPIPIVVKQKITAKVIAFLVWLGPTGHDIHEISPGADILAYDIFRDRNGSFALQNILFPKDAESADKVMIFLVPEHNVMSGGIYSIFSIATHAKQLKSRHGWEVLVMTRPNKSRLTYLRNRHFTNSVDVFRFDQILRLANSKEIYIHIPEYAVPFFLEDISQDEKCFFESGRKVYINILNQNIQLMPDAEQISPLKSCFERVGQSVAHHAYYGAEFVLKYRIDSILLPAYTDLSNYSPVPMENKEKLIIYSPDSAPHKKQCLSLLKSSFPDFEFVQIYDITFDKYMEYASKCLFSITFGEGFDGYLAQPILQGGIGFAIYNGEFFPSDEFLSLYNIFGSEKAMLDELPSRIRKLLNDPELYKSLNSKLQAIYESLYSKEDYISRIERLCERKYELLYNDIIEAA